MHDAPGSAAPVPFSPKIDPNTHGIAALLLHAASAYPTAGVSIASGEQAQNVQFISYPTLLNDARFVLGGLRQCAGQPKAAVVLLLDQPDSFIRAFWACVLGGYVPCPIAPMRGDPARWADHLAHVDFILDHPLFVSTGRLLAELPDALNRVSLEDLRSDAPKEPENRITLEDVAVYMLTSGSTGNSKAVELTHGNLLASMAGRAERQQLTCSDITLNWIAFDHVAALLESHMIALYVGAPQFHAEPAVVLDDSLNFLRLIDRHRITLAFAPNFLLAQINSSLESMSRKPDEPVASIFDLACLRRIVTGGEANVVQTGIRFLDLLAPHGLSRNALWPAYGMTETCAASVYSHEFPDRDVKHEFAAVGVGIPGLEMRIADDQGGLSSPGQAGELQLRGSMIFRRYHNNSQATEAAFTDDGWFRTGDVGLLEDGRLRLVARKKDSIIVNGVNYFSQELETNLEQLDGIAQSFVAAFPTRPKGAETEQLVVTFATTLPPEEEARLYQLMVAVRNTTIMLWGFRPTLILPLPRSSFPKTSLGKIQRSLMRKRLEAGEFAAEISEIVRLRNRQAGLYAPADGPLETALADIFATILAMEVTELSATASFFDLGGTSLDILKLVRAIERRLGFKSGLPIVLQNPSVRQLALHISSGSRRRTTGYDPIVPLQATGAKIPLFCVHPGNGEIFSLVNVAKYFLNDRPFYALRPAGFNEGEQRFETFEAMLDTYVNAILKRQSEGPYAIAGYSFGCSIAFEIAKELMARGREVGFLGCIDAVPWRQPKPVPFSMAAGLALVTDLISLEQFRELNKELRPELPSDAVCEYVLSFASSARLAELDLDLDRFAVWARVAHSVESILYAHTISGTVETMTIFCSEGYSPRYQPEWSSKDKWRKELRHWDSYVRAPKYVDVPGHHFTIMGPQHVATFQGVLRAEIDEALCKRERARNVRPRAPDASLARARIG
jgi:acyl-CoA synthetase (AMP-forming)/AMP-acid ligase II/thioesterase domain-containing protein/acyl carrier protein